MTPRPAGTFSHYAGHRNGPNGLLSWCGWQLFPLRDWPCYRGTTGRVSGPASRSVGKRPACCSLVARLTGGGRLPQSTSRLRGSGSAGSSFGAPQSSALNATRRYAPCRPSALASYVRKCPRMTPIPFIPRSGRGGEHGRSSLGAHCPAHDSAARTSRLSRRRTPPMNKDSLLALPRAREVLGNR